MAARHRFSGFGRLGPAVAVALTASALIASAWAGGSGDQQADSGAPGANGSSGGLRWIAAPCRITPAGRAALDAMTAAETHGLDLSDYEVAALEAEATTFAGAPCPSSAAQAAWDARMSRRFADYVRDLHQGRVDPAALGFQLTGPRDRHDFDALVSQAAATGGVQALVASLTPPLAQYERLRTQLARYRMLSEDDRLSRPLPVPDRSPVRPGDRYAGIKALRERLVALGDLSGTRSAVGAAGKTREVAVADDVYQDDVVAAVERFQARHGLTVDGIIGPATREALGVSPAARTHQIRLALERLRWLPHLPASRLIVVNIPMFRLWTVEAPQANAVSLVMNVVVGRALNTRTPVFDATLEAIVFAPYWNVPRSILRSEILPALVRDPQYLATHDMEIVARASDDAPVVPLSAESLSRLRDGALRVRQRPGARNALDGVKFVLPNAFDVYLHGTPATDLFARSRRDFSHGCIRVEDPRGLAAWVLRNRTDWSLARIDAAMHRGSPERVALAEPIHVLLFYTTAMVDPADGQLHFADDVYGHDRELGRALTERPREP